MKVILKKKTTEKPSLLKQPVNSSLKILFGPSLLKEKTTEGPLIKPRLLKDALNPVLLNN